jgi:hypothetical protein
VLISCGTRSAIWFAWWASYELFSTFTLPLANVIKYGIRIVLEFCRIAVPAFPGFLHYLISPHGQPSISSCGVQMIGGS